MGTCSVVELLHTRGTARQKELQVEVDISLDCMLHFVLPSVLASFPCFPPQSTFLHDIYTRCKQQQQQKTSSL